MEWHFLVLTLGLLHSFKYFKWFCNVSLLFKVRFLWINRTFFRFTYISCALNVFDKKLLSVSSALLFKREVGIELLWNQQLNFVMPRYMMTNILSLVFFVFNCFYCMGLFIWELSSGMFHTKGNFLKFLFNIIWKNPQVTILAT